ncbi:hypothetical protein GALMADRAFT_401110 [Galerina marginata CBS 339.88]|uniref:Uncharacterized protein n=1 Tax=Galerina marginata (strain CBS 339.88) TaxID=685588 RepID=A0A067TS79_GALM3|nr:hypothetical protein GALMADRAFT_401110 [Galerina marginata CBS 339.88]
MNVVTVYYQSSTHQNHRYHPSAVVINDAKSKSSLHLRNSARPSGLFAPTSRAEHTLLLAHSSPSTWPIGSSSTTDPMPMSIISLSLSRFWFLFFSSLVCTHFFWLCCRIHIYPGTLYKSTRARLVLSTFFFSFLVSFSHFIMFRHLAISSHLASILYSPLFSFFHSCFQ